MIDVSRDHAVSRRTAGKLLVGLAATVMGGSILTSQLGTDRVMRKLSDQEMDAYRQPYRGREARLPLLAWPRELPIDGEPAGIVAIVERYGEWLPKSPVPKLFIAAEPGALLAGRAREFCRTWPNQREVKVKGTHFIQEDSPTEIGTALADFIDATRG